MRLILALLAFLFVVAFPKQVFGGCHTYTVAVIDTGFGFNGLGKNARLCKYGHKDFSIDQKFYLSGKSKVPLDMNGHGTNVEGVIEQYAGNKANYCIVVIKYYSDSQTSKQNNSASLKAIKYANAIKVDYINYSGGGPVLDEKERLAVKAMLDRGGTFVAAAGNNNEDLDLPENSFYPAMDDKRVIVVGNKNLFGQKSPSSNYGSMVKRWEVGENVSAYGLTMTGTSQATAIATGKIVSESRNKCDIGHKQ